MKRITCLVLFWVLLAAVFASCTKPGDNPGETTSGNDTMNILAYEISTEKLSEYILVMKYLNETNLGIA